MSAARKKKAPPVEDDAAPSKFRRVVVMLDVELVIKLKSQATREGKTTQRLVSELVSNALKG